MEKQEYLLKLQMLEQQANEFGEQLKMIDKQIEELKKLKGDMGDFENSKQKDIFAEFGKGIFIKAKVDKKEFLVDVGNKIFVPKTSKDIMQIIESQIKKFEEIKPQIARKVEEVNSEVDVIMKQAKKEK